MTTAGCPPALISWPWAWIGVVVAIATLWYLVSARGHDRPAVAGAADRDSRREPAADRVSSPWAAAERGVSVACLARPGRRGLAGTALRTSCSKGALATAALWHLVHSGQLPVALRVWAVSTVTDTAMDTGTATGLGVVGCGTG
ncbi:hypothetical protein GTS_21890 [Gandjariella thermophila]|uniref:Uncharacterized protein n=1 Tax=Gandjariella thermophila TaxID=1931992 RepID=A0A4D4J7Q9_9PSEU|nr:hypothetical protein GTS_21890 [Gandjariella thermophila]